MLKFLDKQIPKGKKIILKIEKMHCTACAINIDAELEDLEGVYESQTSYAKAETQVRFDPAKVGTEKLTAAIKSLGYEARL